MRLLFAGNGRFCPVMSMATALYAATRVTAHDSDNCPCFGNDLVSTDPINFFPALGLDHAAHNSINQALALVIDNPLIQR